MFIKFMTMISFLCFFLGLIFPLLLYAEKKRRSQGARWDNAARQKVMITIHQSGVCVCVPFQKKGYHKTHLCTGVWRTHYEMANATHMQTSESYRNSLCGNVTVMGHLNSH